jgi:ferritin-like metal-binding protein YciE
MKSISPPHILSDHLERLYRMETHIARELPILAGSVLNANLRRLLCVRAMRARARRDHLENMIRHAHPLAIKTPDSIRVILAEGNRDLARIHHPYSRDVAMIEHCTRIEQHATTAYGIAVPLTHRIGYPRISDKLKLLLDDLETARFSFKTVEAEIFSIAACHPHLSVVNPRSSTPARGRDEEKSHAVQALAVGY